MVLEKTLKIPWTEKIKNEEVYLRMSEENTIWKTTRERRKKWIGDIIRNSQ